ncbi:putative HTH-type transcriptional regulator YdfH [Nymphon striatum]|nr:putative HTH-type transcriptional regulator YdfH [Nymphon striatum]
MDPEKSPLPRIDTAPQTLRDIVQDRMRTAIIGGHFAPGERLVERPLCDQLGVSRTVIRETIRYLEAEGLVEILPNRGPIVARLDWAQAKQIYDIRKQLESAAAMACAADHSPAFPQRLGRALKGLKTSLSAAEPSDMFKASTGFYQLIFEEARHDVAWEIVQPAIQWRPERRLRRISRMLQTSRSVCWPPKQQRRKQMPKGYWIALVTVTDPEAYAGYQQLAPAAFAAYDATFLARGGDATTLEGTCGSAMWSSNLTVKNVRWRVIIRRNMPLLGRDAMRRARPALSSLRGCQTHLDCPHMLGRRETGQAPPSK